MSMKFPQSLKQKHWWWGGGHRHKHGTWLRMPGDGGGGGVRQTSTRCMATHPTSSPSPLHPHACCGHATPHACCGHATTPMHAVGMPPLPCMPWACHHPHACCGHATAPMHAVGMHAITTLPPHLVLLVQLGQPRGGQEDADHVGAATLARRKQGRSARMAQHAGLGPRGQQGSHDLGVARQACKVQGCGACADRQV